MKEKLTVFGKMLILPAIVGFLISLVPFMYLSDIGYIVLFVVHCIVFLGIMVYRIVRYWRTHPFLATFPVFVGSALEFGFMFLFVAVFQFDYGSGWGMIGYLIMSVISAIVLFACSITTKAVTFMRNYTIVIEKQD